MSSADAICLWQPTPSQGRNPLVIHSNRNSNDPPAENLQEQGKQADKILASFNDPSLKIIARVYYKSKEPPQEVEAVEKYLTEYQKRQPQIRFFDYSNYCTSFPGGQFFLFFGHFATSGHWQFFLKGVKDGQIYLSIYQIKVKNSWIQGQLLAEETQGFF